MRKRMLVCGMLFALSAVFLSGCVGINFSPYEPVAWGSDSEAVTQSYHVGAYDAVSLSGGFSVVYTAAEECAVSIGAWEELLQYITVTVDNGVLKADMERTFNGRVPVLYLSAPTLNALSVSGATSLTECDTIRGDAFLLDISGAGDFELDLDVDFFEMKSAGASSVRLSGSARTAAIDISGASDISAFDLVTQTAAVNISGIGSCDIYCSGTLDIDISGAGSLRYRGDPSIHQDISAIASVSKG